MSEKVEKIFESIKEKKVKPKSRWFFLVKDYCVWGIFAVATILGSLAISVIVFVLTDSDWDIYKYLDKSFWGYVLLLLPYFWLVILAGLAWLAYFNYKHTRKGYLANPYLVVMVSVAVSVVLGWGLFANGMGGKIDEVLENNFTYYIGAEEHKKEIWSNPESGLLSGEIKEVEDKEILLEDFDGKEWQVETNEAQWRKSVSSEAGEEVKIVGKIEDEETFKAQEIRPWQGKGEHSEDDGEGNGGNGQHKNKR